MVDIDELERLLAAATPGDLSTAERHVLSEYVECPMCGGDGEVGATDYCNFDGVALGVQFYGIGHEFGAHEKLWVAVRNSLTAMLTEIRELRAENARLREAMKGPLAWLERWAVHVGNCETNPECTCGLMFAQHELRAALGEPQ